MNWIKKMYHYCKQKFTRDNLKYMPLFILFGHQSSGRKTLLEQSGIAFTNPDDFSHSRQQFISQFPESSWWVSEKMAFFKYSSEDKNLKSHLKCFRASTVMNVALIILDITYFISITTAQLQRMCRDYFVQMQHLKAKHYGKIPVYIIFTQCDKLVGFEEFFRMFYQTKTEKLFGIAATEDLHIKYEQLLTQLHNDLIKALESPQSLSHREKIFLFFSQMQLCKQPILDFASNVINNTSKEPSIHLQGIYFTSAKQQPLGDRIDLTAQAHNRYMHLPASSKSDSQNVNCSYFIKPFFTDTLLHQALLLQQQQIKARRYHWLKMFSIMGLPLTIGCVLMTYPIHLTHQQNSFKPTLQTLNHLWHQNVSNFYEKKLARYYPFNQTATKTADIPAFTKFFQPQGLLDHFVERQLNPFIITHPHLLSSQTLLALKHAASIRALFFKSHPSTPSLRFCVRPYTLSANISRLEIIIGQQTLHYQHGPRIITCLHWPDGEKKTACEIQLTTLEGQHYHKRYIGFWSLWQLFQLTHHYHYLSIPVSHYQATFEVINTPDFKQKLAALAHFQLPHNLAPLDSQQSNMRRY